MTYETVSQNLVYTGLSNYEDVNRLVQVIRHKLVPGLRSVT